MGGDTLEIQYDYYLKLAHLYDTIDLDVPWDWKNNTYKTICHQVKLNESEQ